VVELKQVTVPDIGDFKDVPIIEVLVKPGDEINAEDSIVTLESDKATIEIPSPFAGRVKKVLVKPGHKVSEGTPILTIEVSEVQRKESPDTSTSPPDESVKDTEPPSNIPAIEPVPILPEKKQVQTAVPLEKNPLSTAHAGPSVRRFARELGVNIDRIVGSGPKHRILKEDVQAYVKAELSKLQGNTVGAAFNLLPWPQVDFAKYGPIELKPLSRIKQISGANLHRNWVMIPHVTQFDEADITGLEALRKESNETRKDDSVKLTLLAFLMKALISPLKKFPELNASLDQNIDGEANLIIKHFYHIGFAVDTINGLMVPVIRDVDQKGVIVIAEELSKLSALARDGKLKPTDMQGASFTISSLGGIGGAAFTPIINAPEVAILGVSKATIKPVYRDNQFVPRLMLPLSLSYDHRVIDGATAARFTTNLTEVLMDMRLALL